MLISSLSYCTSARINRIAFFLFPVCLVDCPVIWLKYKIVCTENREEAMAVSRDIDHVLGSRVTEACKA